MASASDIPPPIQQVARLLQEARRVLFITGAGLSADSGLPTYRGVGGLYNDRNTRHGVPVEEALSGTMLRRQPAVCWDAIGQLEQACRGASCNPGHQVIARLERHLERVVVLTQNVDGFHRAAGSTEVIDIHGDIHDLKCTGCPWAETVPDYEHLPALPTCPDCGAVIRPDVVLFGEMLPGAKLGRLQGELGQGFDVVFSVGTTSQFPYIAGPVIQAAAQGIPTVEINPARTEVSSLVALRLVKRAAPAMEIIEQALQARGGATV